MDFRESLLRAFWNCRDGVCCVGVVGKTSWFSSAGALSAGDVASVDATPAFLQLVLLPLDRDGKGIVDSYVFANQLSIS